MWWIRAIDFFKGGINSNFKAQLTSINHSLQTYYSVLNHGLKSSHIKSPLLTNGGPWSQCCPPEANTCNSFSYSFKIYFHFLIICSYCYTWLIDFRHSHYQLSSWYGNEDLNLSPFHFPSQYSQPSCITIFKLYQKCWLYYMMKILFPKPSCG